MNNYLSEFNFDSNILVFYVNGKRIEEGFVDARITLAIYLRDHCLRNSFN